MEKKTTVFSIDGRSMAMPRYYKRKFFDDYPDIKEDVNSSLAAKVAELGESEFLRASSLYPGLSPAQVKRKVYESKVIYNEHYHK